MEAHENLLAPIEGGPAAVIEGSEVFASSVQASLTERDRQDTVKAIVKPNISPAP
jgi:hypothetical protein